MSTQTAAKPGRRWLQFSLRTLLLLTTVAGLGLGWLAYERQKAQRERAAVSAIQRVGGMVILKPIEDSMPQPVRKVLADETYVALVDLTFTPVTDFELAELGSLRHVYGLTLRKTGIGDAGLYHVTGLTLLSYLDLQDTKVTDAGMKRLAGLSQLRILDLSHTQTTDDGLKHLAGLSQLEFLGVEGTNVTDQGVRRLKQTLPNVEIVR
jgi:Leucine Rich Repeat (LRR) protein